MRRFFGILKSQWDSVTNHETMFDDLERAKQYRLKQLDRYIKKLASTFPEKKDWLDTLQRSFDKYFTTITPPAKPVIPVNQTFEALYQMVCGYEAKFAQQISIAYSLFLYDRMRALITEILTSKPFIGSEQRPLIIYDVAGGRGNIIPLLVYLLESCEEILILREDNKIHWRYVLMDNSAEATDAAYAAFAGKGGSLPLHFLTVDLTDLPTVKATIDALALPPSLGADLTLCLHPNIHTTSAGAVNAIFQNILLTTLPYLSNPIGQLLVCGYVDSEHKAAIECIQSSSHSASNELLPSEEIVVETVPAVQKLRAFPSFRYAGNRDVFVTPATYQDHLRIAGVGLVDVPLKLRQDGMKCINYLAVDAYKRGALDDAIHLIAVYFDCRRQSKKLITPDHAALYFNLSRCYARQGNLSDAIACIEAAIAFFDKDHKKAQLYRIDLKAYQALQKKSPDDYEKAFTEMVEGIKKEKLKGSEQQGRHHKRRCCLLPAPVVTTAVVTSTAAAVVAAAICLKS